MKRFYKAVSVEASPAGWQVLLDGRAVKTPAKAAQSLPTNALAEALAGEWRAQGDELDPKFMPMRDLADYAIDQVAHQREGVIEKLLSYAETDTLAYRAAPAEPLFLRQEQVWEPILQSFENQFKVELSRVSGIMHIALPDDARSKIASGLSALSAFELAALEMLASLAASLSAGWNALARPEDATQLFDAANLEEDFQAEEWGWDQEAEEARKSKAEAFAMAARFAGLSREA